MRPTHRCWHVVDWSAAERGVPCPAASRPAANVTGPRDRCCGRGSGWQHRCYCQAGGGHPERPTSCRRPLRHGWHPGGQREAVGHRAARAGSHLRRRALRDHPPGHDRNEYGGLDATPPRGPGPAGTRPAGQCRVDQRTDPGAVPRRAAVAAGRADPAARRPCRADPDGPGHLQRSGVGGGCPRHPGAGQLRHGGVRGRGGCGQTTPDALPDRGPAARRADRPLRGDRGLPGWGGECPRRGCGGPRGTGGGAGGALRRRTPTGEPGRGRPGAPGGAARGTARQMPPSALGSARPLRRFSTVCGRAPVPGALPSWLSRGR